VLLAGQEEDYVGKEPTMLFGFFAKLPWRADRDFVSDFMSIRQIPLKRRGYFSQSGAEQLAETESPNEDPEVMPSLEQIRQFVLTDRDLAEKVAEMATPVRMKRDSRRSCAL
jgi:hypothetical protein